MMAILIIVAVLIVLYILLSFIFRKPLKYHNMGISKYNQGDYKGAIECFDKAIQINPLNANPYLYRGYSKNNLGDCHGAIEDYTLAMKRKTPTADDYVNRGALRHQLEDYDGAIEDYKNAVNIKVKDADAYYNLGLSYEKKGLIQTAILNWRIANDFGNLMASAKLEEYSN